MNTYEVIASTWFGPEFNLYVEANDKTQAKERAFEVLRIRHVEYNPKSVRVMKKIPAKKIKTA